MVLRVVLAFLLATLASATGAAEKLSDRQVKQAEVFAANNSLFFLYHEVAHLLVDQLGLPVLGKEEDAADNMATYTLLRKGTRAMDRVLVDAAYGWLLSGNVYDAELETSDFYDTHSLDHQRAYQIVCLMVGSNRDAFGKVADDYGMDAERQETCNSDYLLVQRSMESLLGREWAKSNPGTVVELHYSPVYGDYKYAAEVFRKSGIFENVAEELRTSYSLAKTVTFRARGCGEPNAYYDSDAVEVIFCYELMDDLLKLISSDMPEDVISSTNVARTGAAASD